MTTPKRGRTATRKQPGSRRSGDAPVTWSPVTEEDLPALSGLLTAIEHFDEPSERHTIEELQEAYAEEGSDPERDARLGREGGGSVVAFGWVHPLPGDTDPRRVFLEGGVHPGWRRQGIGHELLDWQLERASEWYRGARQPEHGPLRMILNVEDKLADRHQLARDRGFEAVRWFADMTLRFSELLGGLPAIPELPGIRLQRFSNELSEQVRQAHNEAFSDHWGSQPVSQVRWQERLEASASRPEWSWVALDTGTDEVAGYAMNAAYVQDWEHQGFREGWTDRLGVRRDWRGRGIAKALLAASMHSFADADLEAAGLGVDTDSPTGAFNLYTQLGYHRGQTQVMYTRTEEA